MRAVEHRRRYGYAAAQVAGQFDHRFIVHGLDILLIDIFAVGEFQLPAEVLGFLAVLAHGIERLADLKAEAGAGPAEMGLENLAHVHSRWHA